MSIQGETREKTRINIREPKHYQVIMHNDDFTSMEFVVEILMGTRHPLGAFLSIIPLSPFCV